MGRLRNGRFWDWSASFTSFVDDDGRTTLPVSLSWARRSRQLTGQKYSHHRVGLFGLTNFRHVGPECIRKSVESLLNQILTKVGCTASRQVLITSDEPGRREI